MSGHRGRSSCRVNKAESRDSAKNLSEPAVTQLMVLLGRVRHGLMTEMIPRNAKLKARHAEIQALLAAEAGASV